MSDADLVKAVRDKDAKAAKAALAAGASADARTEVDRPVLLAAIKKRSKSLVKLLLKHGADVNAMDREGKAALHWLADELRDLKIGAAVIDAGAELDRIDTTKYEGWAPIHYAIKYKKRDFAELLVERGASLEVKDTDNGETPLMQLLRSDSGVMNATEEANALWLIEKGADVNTTNDIGAGTLHLAAQSGSKTLMKALLEAGARPTKNEYGGTPLHYCVSTHDSDTELWDELIELGCSLEDRSHGETVIMHAQSSWNPKAVAYFIEKGADLTAKDEDGKTLLERAIALKQTKIVPLIEKALASR